MKMDIDALAAWFNKNKRSFPWRETKDPYRIWVSEVMLQQTQAQVVVPYYERWMEKFPTIAALASATNDEVVKAWEGLGYYSRVRNLRLGAQEIVRRFQGIVPDTKEELLSIPGIGEYTAGAILSFAFLQSSPAIDGNVIRVICRYFSIKGEVSLASSKREIRKAVEELLPEKNSHIISEGLIELGATVCRKKPLCEQCPVRKGCLAYRNGEEEELPFLKKRAETLYLNRMVFIIEREGHLIIKKETERKVMQDLFSFPSFDLKDGEAVSSPVGLLREVFGIEGEFISFLREETHTYTKYRVTLRPVLVRIKSGALPIGFQWVSLGQLSSLPFSSGYRRVINNLKTILLF